MRTARILALCALVVFALSAIAFAEEAEWWGRPPGQKPQVQGKVANVSATNIAVQTKQGVKPFVVNEKTRVRVAGEAATIDDVEVGDPVIVRFQLQANNVPLALGIMVPRPGATGKIVAIDGNLIILKNKEFERKVIVTDETRIGSHGYKGNLADLRVGYRATALGETNNGEVVAERIHFTPAVARGAVVARDGATITVKTVKQLNIVCEAGPNTVVLVRPRVGPNKPGTLDDVVVGAPVNIGFHPNKNGVSPLLWIDVLTGQ